MKKKLMILFFISFFVSNIFASQNNQEEIFDPFEGYNRLIWDFNYNILDKYILKPVAIQYDYIIGTNLKTGINNFIFNLSEPLYAINHLLQGNFFNALMSVNRFIFNSTLGLAGFIDISEQENLKRNITDFNQTLDYWGVPTGPFIMLPFVGPTTVRNIFGTLVDGQVVPFSLLSDKEKIEFTTISTIATRARFLSTDSILETSLDSYNFIKEYYFLQEVKENQEDFNLKDSLEQLEKNLEDDFFSEF